MNALRRGFLTSCIQGGDDELNSGWRIQFEYNADIVENLKLLVPHTKRCWYPVERYWWISNEYTEEIKKLFSNMETFLLQGKLF